MLDAMSRSVGGSRRSKVAGTAFLVLGVAAVGIDFLVAGALFGAPVVQNFTQNYSRNNDDLGDVDSTGSDAYETAKLDVTLTSSSDCKVTVTTPSGGSSPGGNATPGGTSTPGGTTTPGGTPTPGDTPPSPGDGDDPIDPPVCPPELPGDDLPDGGVVDGGEPPPPTGEPTDGSTGGGATTSDGSAAAGGGGNPPAPAPSSSVCTGDVTFTLTLSATSTTNDPQFFTVGSQYCLGGTAAGAQMTPFPAGSASPQGLSATIELGKVPCKGGTLGKSTEVSANLGNPVTYTDAGGNVITTSKLVQLRITCIATVTECGTVTVNSVTTSVPDDLSRILKKLTNRDFRAGAEMLRHTGSSFEQPPTGGWSPPFRTKDS